ncbi:MAG: hypothetical protein WC004_00460 [Candidatus Absconditabacterales bacterium]
MNRLLSVIIGVLTLVITFVGGRKYGETQIPKPVSFVTQSVTSQTQTATAPSTETTKADDGFAMSERGTFRVYTTKNTTPKEALGKNTSFIMCPGADAKNFVMEIGWTPPPVLLDGDVEVSTFGFSLAMVATNQKLPVKFLRAMRKNTLVDGQCIYVANKDTILVYSIALDPSCLPVSNGFECNGKDS